MLEKIGIQTGPRFVDKLFCRMSHPWQPTTLFLPLALALLWLANHYGNHSKLLLILWFLIGMVAWTLIEYLLHRFAFHWTIQKQPFKAMVSGLHMAHHRDTNNPYLIFPPLTASLLLSLLFYLIFVLITQSFTIGALILSGISIAYIYYEWVHYGDHLFKPKTAIGRYQRKYHLAHHFKNPKLWFGVTNPFWDMVFGTYKKI